MSDKMNDMVNETTNKEEIAECTNSNKQNSNAKKRSGSRNKRKTNGRNNKPRIQTKPTNNAAMYFISPELASQAAQFSFSNYLGQPIELGVGTGTTEEIPTVLTMAMNPSPGITAGNLTDGINIAGMRTYTRLSAGNAKTTNYAPQDVSTLILAIGEVISMFEVAKRAMRVAYTYNQRNRSLPLGIIRASGIDPEFVKTGQIGPLRLKLNYIINSFNQVPIMANISYFEKCAEIYANYYSDSQGMMTQYYVFAPFSTWKLDETSYDQGSILKTEYVCLGGTNRVQTMDSFLDTIAGMVNAILESATFNYIFADILRLCGPNDLLTIPLLSEMESQLPVFDPMKLLQIHNSVSLGSPRGGTSYVAGKITPQNDVYPNVATNSLEYYPKLSGGTTNPKKFILDFPHSDGNPDLDQRVDATRYLGFVARGEDDGIVFNASTMPDHYITDYTFFYNQEIVYSVSSWFDLDPTNAEQMSNFMYAISAISKFDWHPLLHCKATNTSDPYRSFGDIDFFTVVDAEYIKTINDLAFQGLFEFRTNKF